MYRYLLLVFFLGELSSQFSSQVHAKPVTKQKYYDYYSRKTSLKRQEEAIERGRLDYIDRKKTESKREQRIASEFARRQNAIDKDKKEKIAERWMRKQNEAHRAKMNAARSEYISQSKKKYKYNIPESEEYDIE